jgi:hypothetical protein
MKAVLSPLSRKDLPLRHGFALVWVAVTAERYNARMEKAERKAADNVHREARARAQRSADTGAKAGYLEKLLATPVEELCRPVELAEQARRAVEAAQQAQENQHLPSPGAPQG